ncbi:hypothetical protein KDN24_24570 [Bacillus sp. Bva_UNVM-123]|uniref:hypothetical protein n=1 Tax=Bacillus sp. Bva_UNVM-123 TaxID=2829798 RepID=UPI00391F6385
MDKISKMFEIWMEEKRLLYVTVVIQKKGRRTFYGRIIHFSLEEQIVLFYNEDQASTESYYFKEIDNIDPAESIL